ncbi:hypothetical protein [Streptomyces californicus]|uniref:hypothetical protein n=1 Tax=Streptomyces californicus TaxID=67351 RepID=UPI0004C03CDB|nr:hypothetical protein [Streptomyces californicus]QRV59441.1 hypothetical protein I6J40_34850 [Streptomyces californicus]
MSVAPEPDQSGLNDWYKAGCSRACANQHTLQWGRCAHAEVPTDESFIVAKTALATPESWPYICGTPRHTKLLDWLRTHDIEPSCVSSDDPLSLATGSDGTRLIEYTQYLVTAEGHRYLDPKDRTVAAKETRRAPVKTDPPRPKRADITTLALLQAIHDHATRPVPLGKYRWEIPGAWWTLCTVYPEKVVTAAYVREDDRGHLECGVSLRTSWLTDEGRARLVELRGAPI